MSKKLVAYFSASGVTRKVAETLAEAAGANLYEIKPLEVYTKEDLNWRDDKSRSSVEMKDKSSRPALADTDAKIVDYDTIFIGFPIWWQTAPTIINTFLESYDFAGKTIVAFATSGSSGIGDTVTELKSSVDAAAVFTQGSILKSNQSKENLIEWMSNLGL